MNMADPSYSESRKAAALGGALAGRNQRMAPESRRKNTAAQLHYRLAYNGVGRSSTLWRGLPANFIHSKRLLGSL